MENPPTPERTAADRSDHVQGSLCNDLRVDDERQHRRVSESESRCKPVGAGRLSTQKPISSRCLRFIDVRITYLASGCREGIDLHPSTWDDSRRPQGGVFLRLGLLSFLTTFTFKHNIVIDKTRRARLADFGLLTVVSDSIDLFSSSSAQAHGGTLRWMSPELIAPERFGSKTSCPTKSSDCYSLGMVVYETFSGNIPFHETPDRAVFLKIVEGEHPSRGEGFTNGLWEMMEWCWMSRPDRRPSVESFLEYLEMCSREDLSCDNDVPTPAGNTGNLHLSAPLVNISRGTGGTETHAALEVPIYGGTLPAVPSDNRLGEGMPRFPFLFVLTPSAFTGLAPLSPQGPSLDHWTFNAFDYDWTNINLPSEAYQFPDSLPQLGLLSHTPVGQSQIDFTPPAIVEPATPDLWSQATIVTRNLGITRQDSAEVAVQAGWPTQPQNQQSLSQQGIPFHFCHFIFLTHL